VEDGRTYYCYSTPGHLLSALFVTAVLAGRKDLGHQTRSHIISHVREFDIHSPHLALNGILEALDSSSAEFQFCPRPETLRHAVDRAENWFRQGVRLISGSSVFQDIGLLKCPPRILFVRGNPSILDQPSAAILNSRKPRKVVPGDTWLVSTEKLLTFALDNDMAIVSSFGSLPYSLVSYLAQGYSLIVVCDDVLPFMASQQKRERFFRDCKDLFRMDQTVFVSPYPPGTLPSRLFRSSERDRQIAAIACLLLVATVRPGGNVDAIMKTALRGKVGYRGIGPVLGPMVPAPYTETPGISLDASSQADDPARGNQRADQKPRPKVNTRAAPRAVRRRGTAVSDGDSMDPHRRVNSLSCRPSRAGAGSERQYLIHYTRSCPGPWPGQSVAAYCRSVIEKHCHAAHTAFDTLNRILEEKLIRGSSRMIRGKSRVVSFTECYPVELNHLIEWRTGLIRWNLEPYGIAIRKDTLLNLGVGRVVYGAEEDYAGLNMLERYRFQLNDRPGKDWTVEKEWRLLGDLHIEKIRREDLVVIVSTEQEATIIEKSHGLHVDVFATVSTEAYHGRTK
jgi:hypothetical protein